MPVDHPSDASESLDSGESPVSSRLLSRILITWGEIMVVGFAGAAVGGAASGPPQLVAYLATTLLTVGLLLYNVDKLIQARL